MIALGVSAMLALMGLADLVRQIRLYRREERLAALDEDDRRERARVTGRARIGYRSQ